MRHERCLCPSLAITALLFATLTACGGHTATTATTPATSAPVTSAPASTFVPPAPTPTRHTSQTGVYPYDYGYNQAGETNIRTAGECEYFANSVWDQIPDTPGRESEFLLIYQGCVDSTMNRVPDATSRTDFPPGGIPYVDPCQEGDIEPWIVIYDGPGGSGDISVGAPCQEMAEQYALEQLPEGSFVVESFKA